MPAISEVEVGIDRVIVLFKPSGEPAATTGCPMINCAESPAVIGVSETVVGATLNTARSVAAVRA